MTADVCRDQMDARRPVQSPPVWYSRTSPLSEVLHGRTTPTIVRDRHGHDSLAQRDVYVHSVSTCGAALADGLTADHRCGLVSSGRRYLIPVDHRGWFELLSQDGHAATPLTSVQQLMKLTAPQRCLVRRSIAALPGDDDTGRRTCKISAGETLAIEGSVSSPTSRTSRLRCTDSSGRSVLLSADQRGLFSPIAGPTDVAGVHRMRSIVAKFRLPIIVRLITRNAAESLSSNNSGSTGQSGVAFRVTAVRTEPAAYVVPLWLINCPTDTSKRSLLTLVTSAQASSILDGLTSASRSTNSVTEDWSETEWNELRRRCDELIKSGAVSAELMKLFPTHSVSDRQRTGGLVSPSAQPQQQPRSAGGEDERRLLREIDHIYEAIKAGDVRARTNASKTAALTRQAPRRYRSVRQLNTPALATLNNATAKTRTPARRSHTMDPSYSKTPQLGQPAHHAGNAVDPTGVQQVHKSRPASPSPVRLRRVVSQVTTSAVRRHSPPLLQPQQLQLCSEQRRRSEPVYEELASSAVHAGAAEAAGKMTVDSDTADSEQYIALADPPALPADNLRHVVKHNSTTPPPPSRDPIASFKPSRRWSVAAASDRGIAMCQLKVFDDLTESNNNYNVAAAAAPVTQQPLGGTSDSGKSASGRGLQSDTVSSGRLTSSSSDDATAADRKSSSALAAAVSGLVKRALRRHPSKTDTTPAAATEQPADRTHSGPAVRLMASPRDSNTHGGPSRQANDVAVTSPTCDVIALDCAGGKVTHF